MINPTIIEERNLNVASMDVFSRLMMDRIIFLGTEIDPEVANTVIAQLLFLDQQKDEEITIYINSPGGDVDAGLAIYDTMQLVNSPIKTVCVGLAASMASIILVGGKKRLALPHSKVLIHQPWGITGGQTKDVLIAAKELEKAYNISAEIISNHTGQPFEKVYEDMDRDNWMSSQEALDYGIIDEIIQPKNGKA